MCWKVLALVLSPSLRLLLLKVTLPSAPSLSFPIFALNAPLEPMSQLFHALAGGYALLSNLYSTHVCISILFRVSVHYRPHDISLQLRTKVERKRGRLFAWCTHCFFLTVNGKEMDSHIFKCMNKIHCSHSHLLAILFKYFHISLWSFT